jgi:peroxiredoxin
MPRVSLDQIAPDFTLPDLHGDPVHLADFQGRQPVLLVLNRSLTWPHARAFLAQLRENYSQFVTRDVAVAVVGKEDADAFNEYWTRELLPYMALPNPRLDVLDMYGQEINVVETGRMPALILVDRDGIVRYAHYGSSQTDIPSIEEILNAVDRMEGRAAA